MNCGSVVKRSSAKGAANVTCLQKMFRFSLFFLSSVLSLNLSIAAIDVAPHEQLVVETYTRNDLTSEIVAHHPIFSPTIGYWPFVITEADVESSKSGGEAFFFEDLPKGSTEENVDGTSNHRESPHKSTEWSRPKIPTEAGSSVEFPSEEKREESSLFAFDDKQIIPDFMGVRYPYRIFCNKKYGDDIEAIRQQQAHSLRRKQCEAFREAVLARNAPARRKDKEHGTFNHAGSSGERTVNGKDKNSRTSLQTSWPGVSEEYFEYVSVLSAAKEYVDANFDLPIPKVGAEKMRSYYQNANTSPTTARPLCTNCRRPFTVVELGSGYGHWTLAAHKAVQQQLRHRMWLARGGGLDQAEGEEGNAEYGTELDQDFCYRYLLVDAVQALGPTVSEMAMHNGIRRGRIHGLKRKHKGMERFWNKTKMAGRANTRNCGSLDFHAGFFGRELYRAAQMQHSWGIWEKRHPRHHLHFTLSVVPVYESEDDVSSLITCERIFRFFFCAWCCRRFPSHIPHGGVCDA